MISDKERFLANKKILITRSLDTAKETTKIFEDFGASVFLFPALDFQPVANCPGFDDLVKLKEKIDFIIFTSVNTVIFFDRRLKSSGADLKYDKIRVITVGKKTASVCEKLNIPIGYISPHQNAKCLVEYFKKADIKGKLVLYPCSNLANNFLPNTLSSMGATVKAFVLYENSIPSEEIIKKYIDNLGNADYDWVVFTSPSSFRNFLTITKEHKIKNVLRDNIVSIGETTSAEILNNNYVPFITSSENSIDGIIESMINYYKSKENK